MLIRCVRSLDLAQIIGADLHAGRGVRPFVAPRPAPAVHQGKHLLGQFVLRFLGVVDPLGKSINFQN